ncbi:glycosyltransferase [Pseudooceanicola sp. CBS1P-1]|uniref:Glycosyltransferase n=1 Tax=Pseudooceanicola albus TaxID=2692189 RepID=A0A6L7FYC4_9RHOB|nr:MULTISPECIES: glycosyltransferase family 2 protein [Pseudooceanicola]MBT9382258.1 glycosyltransferase [Pseudooceanicola endophyticus]MXN16801.1 glycosyltransferase [Pseudooceanicola albus]
MSRTAPAASGPTASIVVPCYNARATLAETLDSLTRQSLADLEIIVVDDGATDDSVEIAGAMAARDPRIRLVRQANRGLAGARNSGIHAARGRYIGFCDADDLWAPGKLAAHVAHLEADPLVGLSFSGSVLMDASGRLLRRSQQPRLSGISAAHVFKRNPVGNGSAAVMRRAALEALAWRPAQERERDWIFDETFRQSEDIECWLRLALTTDWQIEGIPGLLTRYRITPGGLSAATGRQYASWQRMVEKLTPLDPAFFARHLPAARAYQLRYLARRAVSDQQGPESRRLMRSALATSLRPLAEEPLKTLTTGAAALLIDHPLGQRLHRAATRPA